MIWLNLCGMNVFCMRLFVLCIKISIQISQPNLTYQKANTIVKEYLFEDMNRIDQLKYKTEEKFSSIHYVYSTLFTKIYNRTNNFGIQKKSNFDFYFSTSKNKKTTGPIGQKILKQLPAAQAN